MRTRTYHQIKRRELLHINKCPPPQGGVLGLPLWVRVMEVDVTIAFRSPLPSPVRNVYVPDSVWPI